MVTGSNGFIGKNLVTRLSEISAYEVLSYDREHTQDQLTKMVNIADSIIHLAGVNRPKDEQEFFDSNADLTSNLCNLIIDTGRKIPFVLASSTQALLSNSYGQSKLMAEAAVQKLAKIHGNPVTIYRFPGVFGKWCRPNYNSVVATFCYNIINNLPIQIKDPNLIINLVYVDDVVDELLHNISIVPSGLSLGKVDTVYSVTLGDLAAQITSFKNSRDTLITQPVGVGFSRALYSTYVSYLPPSKFFYDLPKHTDERGVFVEMLKTNDSGQFSYFTAYPGITRGGHYHHTKTEKFLVIKGMAKFRFRHIVTGDYEELSTSGDMPQVVETVPGWTHDITNVGNDEMFVMLWANEIFDRERPDTISSKV